MNKLYRIEDDYTVKYIPTSKEFPVLAEGPKTYRVKTEHWQSRGKMIAKDSVDRSAYGVWFSSVEGAWKAYLKHLADAQQANARQMNEIGDKIRLAIASMRMAGIAP